MSHQTLLALGSQRDKLEASLKALHLKLQQHGVTLDEPLVDKEGFPRPNLDHWAIRELRQQIRRSQNDYKSIMEKIAQQLMNMEPSEDASSDEEETQENSEEESADQTDSSSTKHDEETCFSIVSLVHEHSPAATAGLKVGDLVYQFGDLTAQHIASFGLSALAQTVQANLHHPIQLGIIRSQSQRLTLTLVPQPWSGRGFLGCKLDPQTQVVPLFS